jgi:acetoin utilization protein AcuB
MTEPLRIRDRMSPLTHTIGDDQPMSEATRRMHEFQIRHLAVLRGGRLVGILSERDIALVQNFPGVDPETTVVAEAMTDEPYHAGPDALLVDVLDEMAKHKYGAAMISENGKAVGIFTNTDAVALARDLLRDAG